MTVHGKQMTFGDIDDDYKAFVEKFKPKKTTDDCYTPQNIYEAVLEWAAQRYGFPKESAVRPFWPGGDYERFDYPDGCVVVDNPPFSILTKIVRFYNANKVHYFLFAPLLTCFIDGGGGITNYVTANVTITYENGAEVNTGFVTDLGEWLVDSAPDLHDAIEPINAANRRIGKKEVAKLELPMSVLTAARSGWYACHKTAYRLRRSEAVFIRELDNYPSGIYGGGLLLSERAAAERAAAERAAAERAAARRVPLSPRELKIQKMLGEAVIANLPFIGGNHDHETVRVDVGVSGVGDGPARQDAADSEEKTGEKQPET